MKKIIHIHAKCGVFEIFEQVPEGKAVSRLESIKKRFLKVSHWSNAGKLVVNTCLVNPTLF